MALPGSILIMSRLPNSQFPPISPNSLLFPIPYSLFPIPYSLFPPIPYSLFPVPCSLFPVPCSLLLNLRHPPTKFKIQPEIPNRDNGDRNQFGSILIDVENIEQNIHNRHIQHQPRQTDNIEL